MFGMLDKQMIEELKRPMPLCLKAPLLDCRYPLKKQLSTRSHVGERAGQFQKAV